MSKLEKLDLLGVASLAAVAAVLLVAWMVTTHDGAARHARQAPQGQAVGLTDDGRMKLTVVSDRGSARAPVATSARTASVRPSSGPSLEVALPFVFRP